MHVQVDCTQPHELKARRILAIVGPSPPLQQTGSVVARVADGVRPLRASLASLGRAAGGWWQ